MDFLLSRARYACLLLLVVGVGCASREAASVSDGLTAGDPLAPAAFLVGTWRTRAVNGTWTEEHWTAPAGGSMIGGSRTIGLGADGSERLKFFEFLRISASASGVTYHAAPLGRSPATEFLLVTSDRGGEPRIVFENPEHDFPTRVIYWLDGEGRLHGRIEGAQGGKDRVEEWVYERVPGVG